MCSANANFVIKITELERNFQYVLKIKLEKTSSIKYRQEKRQNIVLLKYDKNICGSVCVNYLFLLLFLQKFHLERLFFQSQKRFL